MPQGLLKRPPTGPSVTLPTDEQSTWLDHALDTLGAAAGVVSPRPKDPFTGGGALIGAMLPLSKLLRSRGLLEAGPAAEQALQAIPAEFAEDTKLPGLSGLPEAEAAKAKNLTEGPREHSFQKYLPPDTADDYTRYVGFNDQDASKRLAEKLSGEHGQEFRSQLRKQYGDSFPAYRAGDIGETNSYTLDPEVAKKFAAVQGHPVQTFLMSPDDALFPGADSDREIIARALKVLSKQ